MGVPKFYRWMSERYPCLSETVKEFQIPEFDNLYLDMNGIIHICSHPEDDNPHFRITEEKIFKDIFHYIEFLFRMIKPKKVFYMAVDGVAPRAKMNQQRGRRFRSAREAEELIKKAQEKGEVLPTEKRFDSNCITPGTEFMVRLQDQLKYFCADKVSTDPLWQGPRIFISGHETPGEGEHKVMDFIRYERSQPGYDPNTRHCLYGLDADLMILGMATHEPHFSLLREEVRFGSKKERNKRPATPEETTFHLLHLSLLREYLDYEFSTLKDKVPFHYNLENIIDDWILMGFLVGNDFIPNLPNLHINHDALPYLWRTYEKVLPTLDGYLNEGGHLNLKRFEKYLAELAKFDVERFSEQFSDMKWLESKVGKKGINEAAARAAQEERERKERKKSLSDANPFAALVDVTTEFDPSKDLSDSGAETFTDPTDETTLSDLSDDDLDIFDAEFRQHKRNYYMDKLNYQNVTTEVLQEQARCYVLAIQWILLYYFEGVPSWSWFYPHHYAPYISDVKDFSDMRIELELGEAFLPFQQLMAVLPSASKDLLPTAFQELMTNETSPVIDFYPKDFKSDLNGKQQDWEAVVLIPFINENRLLEAMEPKYEKMTKAERARNRHGPSTMFVYSAETQPPFLSTLPGVFPDINANHARMEEIPKFQYRIDGNRLRKGLLPEVRLEVYYPGFPTLKHIQHTATLKKDGVKVFQMNSRGENMVLSITQTKADLNLPIEEAAHQYLGNCVYVGWPHLFEAKVIEVSNGEISYKWYEHKGEKGKKSTFEKIERKLSKDSAAVWRREAGSIKEKYHDRLGVNIGHTEIVLYALPMTGRKYVCGSHGRITLEKQFCVRPVPYALQTTVKDIAIHDPDFQQFKTLEELFPKDTNVFMIGNPHYGSQGEVIDIEDGRIRVNFSVPMEPEMNSIKFRQDSLQTTYMPGFAIAQKLGISGLFLSRITGVIFILQGHRENPRANRINIGLNLKHTKRNQELPGYTKKVNEHWMYSEATLKLVQEYIEKFHDILKAVAEAGDLLSEDDLFPPDSEIKLRDVQEYVKNLPCNNVKPLSTGSEILEEGIIEAIEEEVDRVNEENKKKLKKVKMQVKPHLLFRPLLNQGPLVPDQSTTYSLYDRVVAVKLGYPVPMGVRGTVVGIHPDEKESDTLYDVVFDHEFVGGISVRCSNHRGYRVPGAALINLSHGERKDRLKQNPDPNIQEFRPSFGNWGQGAGRKLASSSHKQNYSNLMGNKSATPHMHWGASERRPNQRHEQFDGSSQKQQYNHYNGRDSFEKGFGQKSGNFSNSFESSPQFVTPKVTQTQFSKRTPNRGQQLSGKQQPQSPQDVPANSEFANMWKELQANCGKPAAPPSEPTSQEPSLKQAALALGQITPPSSKGKHNSEQNADKSNVDITKIDLKSLFDKVSLQKETMGKDEFTAMMDSLSVEQDDSNENKSNSNVTEPSTDSTSALRNLLKIEGSTNVTPSKTYGKQVSVQELPPEGSTNVTPSKTYGKQVSVQELFDGAKQQEKSPPKTNQPSHPPQTQSQIKQKSQGQGQVPQQQQGRQPHPGPPMHPVHVDSSRPSRPPPEPGLRTGSGPGNPVLDLDSQCKAIGIGSPGYDFKRMQGRFTSMVMLPNGTRFEGSECNTKEEAAESAASIALLHLFTLEWQMILQALDRQQHPPFMTIPPPRMMMTAGPPPRHLSSANSAFSPVRPAAGVFITRGGYSQLRHPRHQYPGPPMPPQHFQGPHQLGGHTQHYPANQNVGSGSWKYHHSNQYEVGLGGGVQNADFGRKSGLVTDPAFIPLQVARNQKTPQKRRDIQEQDNGTVVASRDFSRNKNESKHSDSQSAHTGHYSALKSEHSKSVKHSESRSAGQQSHGKKRRPRIAANFNFNS